MVTAKVMRAQGLGVVEEVGRGSELKVGDFVSGAWGEYAFCYMEVL